MGPVVIAMFFTFGASAWLYNHFMRTTGGITERAVKATAAAGVVIFIVSVLILKLLGL